MHPSTLQGYVWHCHILDHEDHDMMLRYRVRA
nr:multicopper oxidase domain-containing protein [Williamsia herbipolensis]